MDKNIKDFTEIYKKFGGLWVALDKNEEKVVGAGKKVKEAVKEANEKGENSPILFKVPRPSISWIGAS